MYNGVMNMSRSALILVALVVVVLAGGCEERVVRTDSTGWIGSPYEYAEKDTIGVYQPRDKGALESVGDGIGDAVDGTGELLFGWMDGDKKKQPTTNIREIRPEQRMGLPQQSEGGGVSR